MRCYFFFILLCSFVFFSCKKTNLSTKKSIPISKVDSLKEKYTASINNKESIKQEKSFLERLRHINREKYPFKFHEYFLDSLNNEGIFYDYLYKLLGSSFDSISKANTIYNEAINTLELKKESNSYKNYYSLLFLKEKNDSCCLVSEELVFKRLPQINDSIENFLTLNRFKGSKQNYYFGIRINIVTYNVKKDVPIDTKAIAMFGNGYDNTEYYEGFVIYKDSIIVKGYNYTEPEMNIINKRFYISETGMIESSYDIGLINFE